MMMLKNENVVKNILNLLLALIPISFIAGNLFINLNIIVLILFAFFNFKSQIFKYKFSVIDKLILFFFFYILINGILNNYLNFNYPHVENLVLKKTILFIRFLFLYFVIKFSVKENLINYKTFFASAAVCAVFVSLDVIVQYSFGKDIFGFEGSTRRMGGPFGDEYIAGAYIQKFFIFALFFLIFFLKIKNQINFNLFIFILISVISLGIIFAGNRMPFLIFILTVFAIFIFEKQFRKFFVISFIIGSIIFLNIFNSNPQFKMHYSIFKNYSYQIVLFFNDRLIGNEIKSSNVYFQNNNIYVKEFETGFQTWGLNKYFGGGIKSFYWNCNNIKDKLKILFDYDDISCNIHPHNYYIEILAILGIVGMFIYLLIITKILYLAIKKIYFNGDLSGKQKYIIPFFILFMVEIFPLKTTGSFFTTGNATFIFLILSFLVSLLEYKENNNE